jgi:hypothetical protein
LFAWTCPCRLLLERLRYQEDKAAIMRSDTPTPTPTPTPIAVLLVPLCVVVEFTDGDVAVGAAE